jgi:hypothetical protein
VISYQAALCSSVGVKGLGGTAISRHVTFCAHAHAVTHAGAAGRSPAVPANSYKAGARQEHASGWAARAESERVRAVCCTDSRKQGHTGQQAGHAHVAEYLCVLSHDVRRHLVPRHVHEHGGRVRRALPHLQARQDVLFQAAGTYTECTHPLLAGVCDIAGQEQAWGLNEQAKCEAGYGDGVMPVR